MDKGIATAQLLLIDCFQALFLYIAQIYGKHKHTRSSTYKYIKDIVFSCQHQLGRRHIEVHFYIVREREPASKVKWLVEAHRGSGTQASELSHLGSFMCSNLYKRLKFTSEILEEKLLSWDTRKRLSGGCP